MKSKKDMSQADWDKFYSEHPRAPADRFLLYRNKVLPHVLGMPATILDVGCGTGDGLLEARKLFPDVLLWGVDYSGEAIAACRRRVPLGMFVQVDITWDSFPFNAELVMCVQTLEHFRPDQIPWIVARLLRAADHQLLISVPYKNKIADKDHKTQFNEHSFGVMSPDIVSVESMHMTFGWIRR